MPTDYPETLPPPNVQVSAFRSLTLTTDRYPPMDSWRTNPENDPFDTVEDTVNMLDHTKNTGDAARGTCSGTARATFDD